MRILRIAKIEVDELGRLLVFPDGADPGCFQYVYRAAAEVYWDKRGCFHSPMPREWTCCRWLEQIRFAVLDELGIELVAGADMEFNAVPARDEIEMRRLLKGADR